MAADKPDFHFRLDSTDFDVSLVQVRTITGREAISQPFWFDIEIVVTGTAELAADRVLGASASLVFERDGLDARTVHGMISAFSDLLDTEPGHRSYRVRLVPRLHRLTFVEMQDVYLDLPIPEIIKQKLALVNLTAPDVDFRLLEKYLPRDIVVQYRETDLGFVSRLAEHLGISYWFDHQTGVDRVIFTDNNSGFAKLEGLPSMHYRGRGDRRDLYKIELEQRLFPANYAVLDYDYRAPLLELTSTFEHPAGFAGGVAEYGAHHRTPAEGDKLAEMRAQERDAENRFYRCESDLVELAAGGIVGVEDHPRLDNVKLLIAEVEHHAVQVVGLAGGDGQEGYSNTFRAVDASRTYRPPRVTPRPRIHGVLTAITEPAPQGASGRIAQIDAQGRYTVRFFFDGSSGRRHSSAPVRMAQPHAGDGYGMHFPLRPNVEVTVTFVDGDPDRPIIAGAVPNPVTPTPVAGGDPVMNRIVTQSGVLFQIKDG